MQTSAHRPRRVLLIGATGYVGGRLAPHLLSQGYTVRCLSRDPRKVAGRSWAHAAELYSGDVLNSDELEPALTDVDVVYHLAHSMAAGANRFEDLDRTIAHNLGAAAERVGVRQIVYLGGLGEDSGDLSPHLRSRHEVGDILREYQTPVTEFRAAVIVGSGSLSFEMIHHLVNKLPVMICPRWVYTRTQPIAIGDVLAYLAAALNRHTNKHVIYDIGGPDVLSYGDMMRTVARILNLKRALLQVPLLTPRLSSYWVNLVTPIQRHVARALIESLRHETICRDARARDTFSVAPTSFETAVTNALGRHAAHEAPTRWTDATATIPGPQIDTSHLLTDVRTVESEVPPQTLFTQVQSLGGDNGWAYAGWLWRLRGWLDKQLGGVGLRRGRRHPTRLAVGDTLDFWRVAELEPDRRLKLRAEMRVWGDAWLEFAVEPTTSGSRLTQTASYYPRGLWGHIYWWTLTPVHALVFRGLARAIVSRAEGQTKSA